MTPQPSPNPTPSPAAATAPPLSPDATFNLELPGGVTLTCRYMSCAQWERFDRLVAAALDNQIDRRLLLEAVALVVVDPPAPLAELLTPADLIGLSQTLPARALFSEMDKKKYAWQSPSSSAPSAPPADPAPASVTRSSPSSAPAAAAAAATPAAAAGAVS